MVLILQNLYDIGYRDLNYKLFCITILALIISLLANCNYAVQVLKNLFCFTPFLITLSCFVFRTAGEVCNALVTKGLSATRQKTKEKAMEILLMYIEIEKQEVVQVR